MVRPSTEFGRPASAIIDNFAEDQADLTRPPLESSPAISARAFIFLIVTEAYRGSSMEASPLQQLDHNAVRVESSKTERLKSFEIRSIVCVYLVWFMFIP